MRAAYLDSSAAVKLAIAEPESAALRSWLVGRALTSSVLLRVVVLRAVRPDGTAAVDRAQRFLRRLEFLRIGRLVIDRATSIEPLQLRTLDAIHLASAALMMGSPFAFVSYDERLIRAAEQLGLRVASPA